MSEVEKLQKEIEAFNENRSSEKKKLAEDFASEKWPVLSRKYAYRKSLGITKTGCGLY